MVRDHLAMLNGIRGGVVAINDRPRHVPGDVTIIQHADGSVTRVIDTE